MTVNAEEILALSADTAPAVTAINALTGTLEKLVASQAPVTTSMAKSDAAIDRNAETMRRARAAANDFAQGARAVEAALAGMRQQAEAQGQAMEVEEQGRLEFIARRVAAEESAAESANELQRLNARLRREEEEASSAARASAMRELRGIAEEQARVRQSTVAAAAAEQESRQAAIGDIRERTARSAALRAAILGVGMAETEQVAILRQVEAQARRDEQALRQMFVTGQIGAERFQAELQGVQAELREVERVTPQGATPMQPGAGMDPFLRNLTGSLGGVAGDFARAREEGVGFGGAIQGVLGGLAGGAAMAGLNALQNGIREATRALAQFVGTSVAEAIKAEEAGDRLRVALELRGYGEVAAQELEAVATQLQATTRYSDDAALEVQQLAVSMGLPIRDIPLFTRVAADLASVLQTDLKGAARQLAQTFDGDLGKIGQKVPILQDLTDAELKAGKQLDVLSDAIQGFAARDAENLGGAVSLLTNQWNELRETIGFAVSDLGDVGTNASALTEIVAGLNAELKQDLGFWREFVEGSPATQAAMEAIGGAAKAQIPNVMMLLSAVGLLRGKGAAALEAQAAAGGVDEEDAQQRETMSRLEADHKARVQRQLNAAIRANDLPAVQQMYQDGKIDADKFNAATERINASLDRQREKAEAAGRELREALAEITKRPELVAAATDRIASLDMGRAESLEQYQALLSVIEADEKRLLSLYLDGSIPTLEEYNRRLTPVIASKQRLADTAGPIAAALLEEEHAVEAAAAAYRGLDEWQRKVADARADNMDADQLAITEDTSPTVEQQTRMRAIEDERFALMAERLTRTDELRAAGYSLADAERAVNDELREREELLDGVVTKEEEYARLQSEIAERASMREDLLEAVGAEGDAVDSLADKWARMTREEQRAMAAGIQGANMRRIGAQSAQVFGQAVGQAGMALMQMAIQGEFSAKKMAHAFLSSLSQQAMGAASWELAQAIVYSIPPMGPIPPVVAGHLQAAAIFGGIGIATGIGARAVGGGDSGGASAGGGTTSGSDIFGGSASAARQRDQIAENVPGPAVSVTIIANHPVGDLERFGQQLAPVVQHAIADQGGRTGSRRL